MKRTTKLFLGITMLFIFFCVITFYLVTQNGAKVVIEVYGLTAFAIIFIAVAVVLITKGVTKENNE